MPPSSWENELFNQVNWGAVRYAKLKAANRDPVWGLVWEKVAIGLAENLGRDRIVKSLVDWGLTADIGARAVDHAIREANSMAALNGYLAASTLGIEIKKTWLTAPNCCASCRENAAQGPIDLKAKFSSGHLTPPAHVGCRCALSSTVMD